MVAEHVAVIGGDDHHRVVGLAGAGEGVPDPPELVVDLADHAVVLGSHRPHCGFVTRGDGVGVTEGGVVERVTIRGHGDRKVDVVG